jgi:hypothetical protein
VPFVNFPFGHNRAGWREGVVRPPLDVSQGTRRKGTNDGKERIANTLALRLSVSTGAGDPFQNVRLSRIGSTWIMSTTRLRQES